METIKTQSARAFLIGTFISSLGSMTLFICLMAFMHQAGHSMLNISLVVGGSRFITLIVSVLGGHIADRIPAKKLILWTEMISAAVSGALAWTWSQGLDGYRSFLLVFLLRTALLTVQQPGRHKISKLLSENTYSSNAKQAIWLNKVTHGSLFFAAGLSFIAVRWGNFYWAIAFDALTYLLNFFIILLPGFGTFTAAKDIKKYSLSGKFSDLYFFSSSTAVLDLLLALALCGGNLFTLRMADNDAAWLPGIFASYGFAVWVAGYLAKNTLIQRLHVPTWIAFGLSFLLLGVYHGLGVLTWSIFLLNHHCYWLLFHRYSSIIQASTPQEKMAAVSSARMAQMILVLATGEFLVGAWQRWVPLFWEGTWRAILCFLVAALLASGCLGLAQEKNHET
jgi:hypothetical protein